jgi:hypothetical protein
VRMREIPVIGESGNIDPLARPELFGAPHAVGKALMKAGLRRSDSLHSLRVAQTQ